MTAINPSIEDPEIFDMILWKPLRDAHKKKSSIIKVSPHGKYLKKIKKRIGRKRDSEFYNLAFWNELLNLYHLETGCDIYAPEPYLSQEDELIMKYVCGTDIDRLFNSLSVTKDDLEAILTNVGQLEKIKENENLLHTDFDLRHILVNGGLYIIDLENAKSGNGKVKEENDILTRRIQYMLATDISAPIKKGYDSIPKKFLLFKKALSNIAQKYGSGISDYLNKRYRSNDLVV